MKETISTWVTVATFVVLLLGGAYAYGSLNQHVADLQALEEKTEAQVSDISAEVSNIREDVAHIQGHLGARRNSAYFNEDE